MTKYGLIGYPLSHSFSKKYFTEKFDREAIQDHEYDLFPIDSIAQLPLLLQNEFEFLIEN
jgi:shikimate dehydrogenase